MIVNNNDTKDTNHMNWLSTWLVLTAMFPHPNHALSHLVVNGINTSALWTRSYDPHDVTMRPSTKTNAKTVWLYLLTNVVRSRQPDAKPFALLTNFIQLSILERRKRLYPPDDITTNYNTNTSSNTSSSRLRNQQQPVPGWDIYFIDTTDAGVYYKNFEKEFAHTLDQLVPPLPSEVTTQKGIVGRDITVQRVGGNSKKPNFNTTNLFAPLRTMIDYHTDHPPSRYIYGHAPNIFRMFVRDDTVTTIETLVQGSITPTTNTNTNTRTKNNNNRNCDVVDLVYGRDKDRTIADVAHFWTVLTGKSVKGRGHPIEGNPIFLKSIRFRNDVHQYLQKFAWKSKNQNQSNLSNITFFLGAAEARGTGILARRLRRTLTGDENCGGDTTVLVGRSFVVNGSPRGGVFSAHGPDDVITPRPRRTPTRTLSDCRPGSSCRDGVSLESSSLRTDHLWRTSDFLKWLTLIPNLYRIR